MTNANEFNLLEANMSELIASELINLTFETEFVQFMNSG